MIDDAAIETLFRRFTERFPDANRRPEAKMGGSPFKNLVGVVLSAQSRDAMTAKARDQLFAVADTPEAILALDEAEIAHLIKPCGLYNAKARSVKKLCRAIIEEKAGVVPTTREGLMSLPGVGRKSADITLRFTFAQPFVAVDTHVHRVCNRIGLARGKTDAQTAASLEPRVPDWAKWGAHIWLLEHGKQVCRSRKPRCGECFLADLCEQNGVSEATIDQP